jgi:hypothetical protein
VCRHLRPHYRADLLFPVLEEIRMPAWKVLFIMVFACLCLALGLGTLVVPLALDAEEHRWLWFGGLLLASICMSTLFTLFLIREDRNLMRPGSQSSR